MHDELALVVLFAEVVGQDVDVEAELVLEHVSGLLALNEQIAFRLFAAGSNTKKFSKDFFPLDCFMLLLLGLDPRGRLSLLDISNVSLLMVMFLHII